MGIFSNIGNIKAKAGKAYAEYEEKQYQRLKEKSKEARKQELRNKEKTKFQKQITRARESKEKLKEASKENSIFNRFGGGNNEIPNLLGNNNSKNKGFPPIL